MIDALIVDNHDSFTYNLREVLSAYARVEVLTNDVSLDRVRAVEPDLIVISPGPGRPERARDVGVSLPILRTVAREIPTVGICLGMEAVVHAYGGSIGHAPEPVHGHATPVTHDGRGLFAGLPARFRAGRYHSLVATDLPNCLEATARTADESGLVMGLRHREHPISAVQFHPESVLTPVGPRVLENAATELVGGEDGPGTVADARRGVP